MVCRTASVQRAADKTTHAADQVKKLETMLEQQAADNKAKFYAEIDGHLADAKITDAREIAYNSDIKTEYTSQFSLDKIAEVVTSALNAAIKATDPTVPNAATSKDAIAAYADVVNSVAEAAKSSSQSASSLSFSMNRLSPGMFAFLYATSVNIQDDETFGSEAVTTTAIYYRMMESLDDLRNEAKFGSAVIDAANLLHWKTLQAALTDDVASGKLTVDDWTKKDAAYSQAIAIIQKRLDDAKFDTGKNLVLALGDGFGKTLDHSFQKGSPETQAVVKSSIQRLETRGDEFSAIVKTSRERLAASYF